MAKYSAMFKTISPGMNLDDATNGLVSVMKAFNIVLAPVFSPASLVSKSFNGVSRPLSISAFVDLNLAISVV